MKSRTTLVLSEPILERVRELAAKQKRTMSEIVEEALRQMLDRPAPKTRIPRLPTYKMGPPAVDISDREALYDLMDQDDPLLQDLVRRR